jgi:hypothetical protein
LKLLVSDGKAAAFFVGDGNLMTNPEEKKGKQKRRKLSFVDAGLSNYQQVTFSSTLVTE